jgi:hypothetical protein
MTEALDAACEELATSISPKWRVRRSPGELLQRQDLRDPARLLEAALRGRSSRVFCFDGARSHGRAAAGAHFAANEADKRNYQ